MAGKEVQGIRIKYTFNPKTSNLRADFSVGTGRGSADSFISSYQIRRAIKKGEKRFLEEKRRKMYYVNLFFEPETGNAVWEGYYPFGKQSDFKNIFSRRGIAQLLERKVRIEMKKRFPSLKQFVDEVPLDDRKTQMKKRGIIIDRHLPGDSGKYQPYSYEKSAKLLRNKIRRDRHKAQLKRRQARIRRKKMAVLRRRLI